MKVHQIPFDKTNIYSELITDYLNESKDLVSSISSFPNFQSLINLSNPKSNQFSQKNRDNLIKMGGTAEEIGRSATNNFKKYCK